MKVGAGTAEYQDLAREETISALPATILPSVSDAVRLTTSDVAGREASTLSWQVSSAGSGSVTEELVIPAAGEPLPVSETSGTSGDIQTVEFTHWGEVVSPVAPSSSIPYASLTRAMDS